MGDTDSQAHEDDDPPNTTSTVQEDHDLNGTNGYIHDGAHISDGQTSNDPDLSQKRTSVTKSPTERPRSPEDDADTFHDAENGDIPQVEPSKSYPMPDEQSVESRVEIGLVAMTIDDSHPAQGSGQDSGKQPVEEHNLVITEGSADIRSGPVILTDIRDPDGPNVPAAESTNANISVSETAVHKKLPTQNPIVQNTTPKKKVHHTKENAVSEWSHQRLAPRTEDAEEEVGPDEWQSMPAVAEYDLYDDDGRLIAKQIQEEDAEEAAYGGLGGAGKGYTRVQLDEDAQSATSMDDDTKYLFKEGQKSHVVEDEEARDAMAQLEATKDLLTEGQRIAYVGVTRLAMYIMTSELETAQTTKNAKKHFAKALESMTKWGQQMMVRLYGHMEIDLAEQLMIEQLAEHGVQPADLVPPLMQNSRVKNPMVEADSPQASPSPTASKVNGNNSTEGSRQLLGKESRHSDSLVESDDEGVPQVQTPLQMTHEAKIDLDIRWTVLCDLFLVLIADSAYDSRSRLLLERVAAAMDISWIQICRFEKRVMDALEMQEERNKETWNEDEHMETRRKAGLKNKYIFMGLATVGGGLVIGLSAGLLAPVIGAGLAAGFTTIGVSGTAGFLGGVGGVALITSGATAAGGTIAVRASNRRTGHVKTFEYRPLHNNKRLNLILTVSGWMSGKVDDVRLPYSTVDPIMGDIYSLLWEPEMLQSMGDTINILATEALTQTVQQVLGSTVLVALMASLQLPIVLTKLAYLIDNPWTVSLDRANAAGLILADSLMDRHLGNRPITLVGFSLGSRLIFACLKELAHRGAYGLVQNVYLFGTPVAAKKDDYLKARSIISGRFVNGYASNDWILGYLFRATSGGIMGVAGLAPVQDIPGLENIDVTALVPGHMAYRAAMPRLLREVGWEVESDEFTEIEDPDPENHAKRQRELMREIDDARKEAEAKPETRRFGFFRKGKLAQKKGWETYEHDNTANSENGFSAGGTGPNVLFDIEAIKRELESEMIEVKQLESTLPPMRLDLGGSSAPPKSPRDMLRQTQSSHASLNTQTVEQGSSDEQLPVYQKEEDPSTAQRSGPDRPEINTTVQAIASDDDDEISTSFERDFATPRELKSTLPPLTLSPTNTIVTTPLREPTPSQRPGLKGSATMPINSAILSHLAPVNIEHNAWADEEDELAHEREVKMTFE